MKTTKARTPREHEFEEIILGLGHRIVAIREEAGDTTYTLQVGKMTLEVPSRAWWRIVEEAE